MEILEKAPQSNDIVFFADGSWDAVGSSGKKTFQYKFAKKLIQRPSAWHCL